MAVTGKRQEAGAGGDGDTPAGVGSALPEMLWTLLLDGPEGWLGFHTEGGLGGSEVGGWQGDFLPGHQGLDIPSRRAPSLTLVGTAD